jgi:PIN domain nuclease of toxin-antitoxin system
VDILLDTHAFLWWNADDPKLGRTARAAIGDLDTTVFVSAATAWEIAFKRAKGKLDADGDVADWIDKNAFSALPIEVAHAVASAGLQPHHRDPFDRLLVAQARMEELTLVTADAQIRRYDVETLDAAS